jgi:4-hydroxybenzoate polyprenyltransferase
MAKVFLFVLGLSAAAAAGALAAEWSVMDAPDAIGWLLAAAAITAMTVLAALTRRARPIQVAILGFLFLLVFMFGAWFVISTGVRNFEDGPLNYAL